ncbi:hypothetical protein LXL04_036578 [Taraxacum kok-saghyz]
MRTRAKELLTSSLQLLVVEMVLPLSRFPSISIPAIICLLEMENSRNYLDIEATSSFNASLSDDEYIMAPVDKQAEQPDDTMADEDDTQDPDEDEQLNRVKEWISSYHLDNLDVTDVLSNFPDISLALIEEVMNKLVNEGILSKSGTDSFNIKRPRKTEFEFDAVKEEGEKKSPSTMLDGDMYMKALFHALPMDYITIPKLQSKLGGEVNQTMVRKLMDKTTKEGFIETSSSRRLGKRVVHSEITNKKLDEVRKTLDFDASENLAAGTNRSTVGAFHSIGSECTRSTGRPELQQSVSNTHNNNTPTSNNQVLQPVSSIESYAGMKRGRNGNHHKQTIQKSKHGKGACRSEHET